MNLAKLHPYIKITFILIIATAIWRMLFFAGDIFLGAGDGEYRLSQHILNAIMVFVITVPVVLLIWKYLDKKPWSQLGLLPLQQIPKHFLVGAGIWLIPASIGLAACIFFGWVNIEVLRPSIEILYFIPFLILLVFLYEAFPEELIFRGYIYANLSEKSKGYLVVFIQAILFTLWGVAIGAVESFDRVIFFFGFAWVIGSLRMVSGNIWVPIGFHVAFQTVAQLLLNESRGFFSIDNVGTLQLIAFGILPLASAELLARTIYKDKTNQTTKAARK